MMLLLCVTARINDIVLDVLWNHLNISRNCIELLIQGQINDVGVSPRANFKSSFTFLVYDYHPSPRCTARVHRTL